MKIQDLYPLIADGQIPDYPVEVFADGQPAKLTWKWEFVRQTDEESDEPAEGTNHLRIDVVTSNKPDWKPYFDTAWQQVREYVKENEDVAPECYLEVFKNAINNLEKQIQPI